jgi:hypothetical protein
MYYLPNNPLQQQGNAYDGQEAAGNSPTAGRRGTSRPLHLRHPPWLRSDVPPLPSHGHGLVHRVEAAAGPEALGGGDRAAPLELPH